MIFSSSFTHRDFLSFQPDTSALRTNPVGLPPTRCICFLGHSNLLILVMASLVCSAAGSATVSNQSDDVESTLSPLYEERPLLDSTDEIWAPPIGFLWVQIGKYIARKSLKRNSLSLSAIMSNVFLSGFDGTITASTYAVISSEFNAANTASWLTTSYLITSTAFQPLYGRFSDIFGRRVSFFTATITFVIGCLGCGIANDIVFLNTMRALTGIGGGGLMTMGKSHHPELEGGTHTVQLQLSTPTSFRSDVGVCIKLCKTACMASAPSVVRLLVARLSIRLDGDGASLCRCL